MKEIYLVRHGESEGNAGTHYQNENTQLTELGREQAAFVAERATKLNVDTILASAMVRAQQTAGIISERIGISLESSDLFVERRRPSEQIDQPKDDPKVQEAEEAIMQSSSASGIRYSDEENFDDLNARSKAALSFLEQHPSDKILVVTHGVFLRNIVAQVIFGDALTGRDCGEVLSTFIANNTGITVLQFDPDNRRPWRLLTWNDHAHLG
ncbi:MAG: histidine phosphatase family protein [Patescibacteria group bacterium]